MIQRMSHVSIFVLDQDEACEFYVNKLGLARMDYKMDNGFRWLTVGPKGRPDLQIILMPMAPSPMMDQATSDQLRAFIRDGKLGAGVFQTADCRKTYEELKAKGVEFSQPPAERFHGIEAIMKDNSGKWFSMTQPKEAYEAAQ